MKKEKKEKKERTKERIRNKIKKYIYILYLIQRDVMYSAVKEVYRD